MGTIFKRGKRWYIGYVAPNGKFVRKSVANTKSDAELVLARKRAKLGDEAYYGPTTKPILFDEFAKKYLELHIKVNNKKSLSEQKSKLGILKERFGHLTLAQITQLEVKEFIAERLNSVEPATVNRMTALLKSMFNRAIEWEIFQGVNPVKGIKRLAENNERTRYLTEPEEVCLLRELSIHPVVQKMVIISIGTGLRRSELLRLKWDSSSKSNYVDFKNNIIYIDASQSKSGKSRMIPLRNDVREAFLGLPKYGSYVFTNPQTLKPYTSVEKRFNSAIRRAEIEDFTWHDLRHTFGSRLVMANVPLYEVQILMGHSSSKVTERYAHLDPEKLKDSINSFSISTVDDALIAQNCTLKIDKLKEPFVNVS